MYSAMILSVDSERLRLMISERRDMACFSSPNGRSRSRERDQERERVFGFVGCLSRWKSLLPNFN